MVNEQGHVEPSESMKKFLADHCNTSICCACGAFQTANGESPESQVARLAAFIMHEVPGEPSQVEGAIDTAIRIMRRMMAEAAGKAKSGAVSAPEKREAER